MPYEERACVAFIDKKIPLVECVLTGIEISGNIVKSVSGFLSGKHMRQRKGGRPEPAKRSESRHAGAAPDKRGEYVRGDQDIFN